MSYTFSENKLLFKALSPTSFVANTHVPHSLTAGVNYQFSKKMNTSFTALLKSGAPFSKPVEGNETTKNGNTPLVNYGELNDFQQKTYSRFDASLGYSFLKKKQMTGNLKIGIQNLFNQKNILNSYYILDKNDETKTQKINVYSLGFTPNVSLRIQF